ncbi:hypothetical protein Bca4012_009641 [Brassica carinata]
MVNFACHSLTFEDIQSVYQLSSQPQPSILVKREYTISTTVLEPKFVKCSCRNQVSSQVWNISDIVQHGN